MDRTNLVVLNEPEEQNRACITGKGIIDIYLSRSASTTIVNFAEVDVHFPKRPKLVKSQICQLN